MKYTMENAQKYFENEFSIEASLHFSLLGICFKKHL
jgi:hypothetical protein